LNFDITILGCGAATPTQRLSPTAQFVSIHEHSFLIDCGEGTQIRIREMGFKMQKIEAIFISHLHGDHFFGLIGLLSTFSLLGRTKDLTVIAPRDLEPWIFQTLRISDSYLTFPVHFVATEKNESAVVYETEFLTVKAVPVKHRIACHAFLFAEKPHPLKVKKYCIEDYQLGIEEMVKLKRGEDVIREGGEVIRVSSVCEEPQPPRKYFFCSDTLPLKLEDADLFNVDLLYHESTFLDDHIERAAHTFHSTARQAAQVANHLQAKKLLLGHFSARYHDLSLFATEAQLEFAESEAAKEGSTYSIPL
jgi:ribonuclease Z